MKDAYYFSHDANARHDPRILILRARFKEAGYAWYFMTLEMMREAHDYQLKNDDYIYAVLGLEFGVQPDVAKRFMDSCVELDLFKSGQSFYSESLLRRMSQKEKMTMARRESGRMGGLRSGELSKSEANLKQITEQNSSKSEAVKESKVKERKESKEKKEYSPDFLAFWQAYPNKVGKDKAFEAWGKKAPVLETCLSALNWQTAQPQWVKDGGKYIPHPSTWLNQGRWNDEPIIAKAGSTAGPVAGKYDGIGSKA